MKKQLKILFIIIIAHTQVLAQLPHSCDSENYKTNPLSPIDLRGQPYINEITPGVPKFDWLPPMITQQPSPISRQHQNKIRQTLFFAYF